MKAFSIKEAFGEGWKLFKENKKILILSTLVILLLGAVPKPDINRHPLLWLGRLGLTAYALLLGIGRMKMVLKIKDGEPTGLSELSKHKPLFWRALGVYVLYGLVVVAGLILLIVPGIYWALKYQFAYIILIDKNTSINEAFKQSAELTKGVKWKLLGFSFALLGINILGALAFGIGLLVTIPLTLHAHAHVYRKLSQEA